MTHLCFHDDHGPHDCRCGIKQDHTTLEFRAWHEARGIPVLSSQIG